MAAGGGGAWKVAYADFVTAMMAFFLVMWIVGQDQKTKKAVADYFTDPMSGMGEGSGIGTGSLFEERNIGKVQKEESVTKGQGEGRPSLTHRFGENTAMIHEWIKADKDLYERWQKAGEKQMASALWSADVRQELKSQVHVASRLLAKQIEDDLRRDVPSGMNEMHRRILLNNLARVNWHQIAQWVINPESAKE